MTTVWSDVCGIRCDDCLAICFGDEACALGGCLVDIGYETVCGICACKEGEFAEEVAWCIGFEETVGLGWIDT